VRLRDLQGRQFKRTFDTKRQAEDFAAKQRIRRAEAKWIDASGARIPLRQYAASWFETRADLRPRTRDTYEALLRLHILPHLGDRPLEQITVPLVRVWHGELIRTKSQNLAAKAYRLLGVILRTAVEDGLISKSPCSIRGAGIERSPERPIATIEQVFDLADAIAPRYRLTVLLACFAGLRKGEILALRRDRVDLAERTVTVREQLQELASGSFSVGGPKSSAGTRVVSLPDFLVGEIETHFASYVDDKSSALLFQGTRGGPLRRAVLQRAWAKARTELDLDYLHFHDLRHSGNTLAASTGASTRELMVRMGHASAEAALRYQHASRERDREIAAKLDAMVSGSLDQPPPDQPPPPQGAPSLGDSSSGCRGGKRLVA